MTLLLYKLEKLNICIKILPFVHPIYDTVYLSYDIERAIDGANIKDTIY